MNWINEKMKEFDGAFVGNKVGRVYSWKALALTGCTRVRSFLLTALKEAYERGVQSNINTGKAIEHCAEKDCPECNKAAYQAGAQEALAKVEDVIAKHNARILNQFQLQGTPDMPVIAYDERVCLIPAIKKATEETISTLHHLQQLKDKNNV